MTQFIKYKEKEFTGGNRLDAVVNKDIGSYLKNNELNKVDRERFMQIESMKADFRNQNRFINENYLKDNNESYPKDNNENQNRCPCHYNENYIKPIVDYTNEGKYKKFKSYTPVSSYNSDDKESFENNENNENNVNNELSENNNNDLIEDCQSNNESKNNKTLLIIFIILFIIIIGLIILLKITDSNNIIEFIKKLSNKSY